MSCIEGGPGWIIVLLANRHGTEAGQWSRSGRVTERLPHNAYSVVIDGSGRVTKRTRQHLIPVSTLPGARGRPSHALFRQESGTGPGPGAGGRQRRPPPAQRLLYGTDDDERDAVPPATPPKEVTAPSPPGRQADQRESLANALPDSPPKVATRKRGRPRKARPDVLANSGDPPPTTSHGVGPARAKDAELADQPMASGSCPRRSERLRQQAQRQISSGSRPSAGGDGKVPATSPGTRETLADDLPPSGQAARSSRRSPSLAEGPASPTRQVVPGQACEPALSP